MSQKLNFAVFFLGLTAICTCACTAPEYAMPRGNPEPMPKGGGDTGGGENQGGNGGASGGPSGAGGGTSGRGSSITCESGAGDCDGNPLNGCEASLGSDVAHCGRCDLACKNEHGSISCVGGQCIPNCGSGYADCDGLSVNGCETAVLADALNCGGCGAVCSLPHATSNCASGQCVVAACAEGWADCNALPADGCEVNLQTDALHCGSCSEACSTTNGISSCAQGKCAIACSTGFGNCDQIVANGCETDLSRSVSSCGSCGAVCRDGVNATAVCVAGVCGVSSCAPPYGDCDGSPSNGCESNTKSDPNNCGGCGRSCSVPHATAACTNGVCGIASCAAGWADCNGVVGDGCEANLQTSSSHCGGCNAACAPANATGVCTSGVCKVSTCSSGYRDCNGDAKDGCETNVMTSVGNCGACGAACSSAHGTPSCAAGTCAITCAAGYANCDGVVSTGCETQTSNNSSHCGACSVSCVPRNATGVCQNSQCAIGACNANFKDCDSSYATGCEINITTDTSNCLACGNACNSTNGTAACSGTGCGITCALGFADCSATSGGCETNTLSDKNNCGGCGRVCATSCVSGVCATPCTGLCVNPVVWSGSKNVGATSAVCLETTSAMNGGGCGGMEAGRKVFTNGVEMPCGVTWTIPARRNGGYCTYAVAGGTSSAYVNVW